MTLQEQLRLCIGRDRLDDDDQVALVPRWTVKESADELDRLQTENEALRKDAERYRWLRLYGDNDCCEKDGYGGSQLRTGDGLDAAIDAAMKEQKP